MVEAVAEGANRIATAPPWRCRPYPDYRDSGVQWLGEIPAGWSVQPLKHLASFSTGWTPPTGREDLYGGEHLWANISDLGPKILEATEKTISDAAIREARLRIVEAGSLLFSFKLSIGTVSVAGVDMYTNEAIAAFAPSSLMDTNYLFWAAPILIPHNAQDNIYGAPLLSRERIANAKILRPNLTEQRAIATFLDRETAKIDALVARKERLIELLREKRTALITRAVTRGLDPNVPMKDSGVEWLGEVPAHWEVKKLGYLTSIGNGSTPNRGEARYWIDGLHPWLTSTKINEGVIVAADEFVTQAALRECHLPRVPADSILVAITGEGQTRGRTAILNIDSTISQHLAYVTPDGPEITAEFLVRLFEARYEWLREESSGLGSTRAALTCEFLRSIRLAFPPPGEQQAIATMLDQETARIAALIAKVHQAIGQLREFRTALISTAVTGKIDVRGAEL